MVHLPTIYMKRFRLKIRILGKSVSSSLVFSEGSQPFQTVLKACQGCMSFFVYLKESLEDLVYKALALMK